MIANQLLLGTDPASHVPIELITQKIAILARTGAGKTNAAVVIAEGLLDAKQQKPGDQEFRRFMVRCGAQYDERQEQAPSQRTKRPPRCGTRDQKRLTALSERLRRSKRNQSQGRLRPDRQDPVRVGASYRGGLQADVRSIGANERWSGVSFRVPNEARAHLWRPMELAIPMPPIECV